MDIGKIQNREIVDEMRESYLDYAMSVIVARALPDVRDGLKPVHRRILYSMHELGLGHSAKFRKSAAVVGDTLAKYHPHGDVAVYDSMVRMAQDFAMRYPLINGQGNFGSIDGDNAAAMRYTEARMTKLAEELLKDIEKDTVNFRDNYDSTRKEPQVLPAAFPNLLANGTLGIAVGMATNIPPHNLTELIDGLVHIIENPKATSDDLMEFIKGPDFPTGGIIFNASDIRQTYATGKGAILCRGKAEIEEGKKGTYQIIITEIPYQVNKSELIITMANLVQEKRIEGIRDIRDESDKDGLRIAIDLKTDAQPQKILNNLYRHTELERNFNLNMLALVDGLQPQVLSIKNVLEEFVKHRDVVVRRRTAFDLARTKDRIHILEGLKKALDHIDAVIQTIKKSEDKDAAHANLIKKFGLSNAQATAILEMRLSTLAGLERQKIDDELKDKTALAKTLEALLEDPKKILALVKSELLDIKQKYGDLRKTKVVKTSPKEFSEEDLVPEEEVAVVVTRGGYVKRIKPDQYRMQKRGGKGLIGIETKEEDVVEHLLMSHTHADVLFFTDSGKVYQVKAYEIPEGTRTSKGRPVFNFLSISQQERITSVLAIPKGEKSKGYIVMLTRNGIIKKVEATTFENVRRSGLIAVTLKQSDTLGWARHTAGTDDIILATKNGQSIRFSERDVRAMGRQAAGVTGIRLKKSDEVVGMDIIRGKEGEATNLLVIMELGLGKQTPVKQYKRQRRGGSGIKTAKVTQKTGRVVNARIINQEQSELIAISRKGQVIRTMIASVPTLGRRTQGVRIMRMDQKDAIASITTL
ncbi:MAG: DNA gyrase subunit A [Candidatus Sungbacteria bacterium GWC2_49_10]|uniref:DNA gyrase subunit A n=1 Tax=Candidatus Sungbacteria bacterium GWC2_49_10 TaxID=1802263 RepID=A0A1G2K5N3_9BACT|nr:MAG: gyrase subunit A protein [Parcubacteria group bacterium GW2011_GWA2_47_21]OGZ94736.1 MAG: DNA gyrase subunit A [Candidatus Sungbacteria bacterium GWC2_49_10]